MDMQYQHFSVWPSIRSSALWNLLTDFQQALFIGGTGWQITQLGSSEIENALKIDLVLEGRHSSILLNPVSTSLLF